MPPTPLVRISATACLMSVLFLTACSGEPTAPTVGPTPPVDLTLADSAVVLPIEDATLRLAAHIADPTARAQVSNELRKLDAALRAGRRTEARTAVRAVHAMLQTLDRLDPTRAADHAAIGLALTRAAEILDVQLS